MTIELKNFTTHGRTMGYVAYFDVRLECGVIVRGLMLQRPERYPTEAWLVLPNLERQNNRTVHFPPDLRTEIGQRAATAFAGVTGITLEYAPPSSERRAVDPEATKPKPKVAISAWLDRHEPDDAGLKRAIRMGEAA